MGRLGKLIWGQISRNEEYRKVPSTKPHLAYPNFVFMEGEKAWTTRYDKNDAVCRNVPDKRIDLSGKGFHQVQVVHDGKL